VARHRPKAKSPDAKVSSPGAVDSAADDAYVRRVVTRHC
jgi:hypothetical protein